MPTQTAPEWLIPYSVWAIRGKVDPRPPAPSPIPAEFIWFPAWVKWRMNGKVGPRPLKAPIEIPKWAFAAEKEVVRILNRDAGMAFWRRMGVWVTIPAHFPGEFLEAYGQGEYGFVVVPTLFSLGPDEAGLEGTDLPTYIDAARDAGYDVVGSQWGSATTVEEAQAEADAGAAAFKEFGFDGWCFNGEKRYEGGGRSGAYAQRFRARLGYRVPFLWSPEPRLDLDHAVLQECGVAYGPQAYTLENGADVDYVATWARNFGYEAWNTVPLVQGYPSGNGERFPATIYRDQARAFDLPGLILYTGNQTADVPQYWRDLVV